MCKLVEDNTKYKYMCQIHCIQYRQQARWKMEDRFNK